MNSSVLDTAKGSGKKYTDSRLIIVETSIKLKITPLSISEIFKIDKQTQFMLRQWCSLMLSEVFSLYY